MALRHSARTYPFAAMAVAMLGMVLNISSLFVLGAAMMVVSIGVGVFTGFSASPTRQPWKLEGNRLEIGGLRVPLDEVKSVRIERRTESWSSESRGVGSRTETYPVMVLRGRRTHEIWFHGSHSDEDVRWLADAILEFRKPRDVVPPELQRMRRPGQAE
ncbi:MAG: hypothetical protein H6737_10565 [Alphaproteobacteria bacterium]|nr:hypothetical protein [Alphaproteobacteria bacterium]